MYTQYTHTDYGTILGCHFPVPIKFLTTPGILSYGLRGITSTNNDVSLLTGMFINDHKYT